MRLIFSAFFICVSTISIAQSVKNVVGIQSGDNVLVTYNLQDNATKDYYISLHYSIDGGITYSDELRKVSGDIGESIKPGNNKQIIWSATKEIGAFAGEVVFKVEAKTKSASASLAGVSAKNKCLQVDINEIARDGSNKLKIDFTVTPINGNSTIYLSAYVTNTYLQDNNGSKYKLTGGNLAGTPKGKDKAVLNGIPYQGFAIFDGLPTNLSSIKELSLFIGAQGYQSGACAQNNDLARFKFQDISID